MHQQVLEDVNCFLFSPLTPPTPPSPPPRVLSFCVSLSQEIYCAPFIAGAGGPQQWPGVRAGGSLGNSIRGSLGPRDGGQAEVVPPDSEGKSWSVLSRLKHTGVNIAFYHLSGLGRGQPCSEGQDTSPGELPTAGDTHAARSMRQELKTTITPAGSWRSSRARLAYAVSDLPAGTRTPAPQATDGHTGRRRRLPCSRQHKGPGQRGRAAGRAARRAAGWHWVIWHCVGVRGCSLKGMCRLWALHIPGAAGLWRRCSSAAH